jgi:hypothetical protein
MTIAQFAAHICGKMFKTDANSIAACKGFIRRRYQMIYDGSLWKDALVLSTVAADSNIIVMPQEVGLVVGTRWGDGTTLDPVEFSFLLRTDPGAFERTGTPAKAAPMNPIGISRKITTAERLSLVSSNNSDTAVIFLLRGDLAGVEQVEEVTLTGTTTVTTAQSWDNVYVAAKPVTIGTVTMTGFTSALTYLTLWKDETEKKYQRVRLFDSPTDITQSLLVLAKRRFRDLTSDQDTPQVQAIENALLAFGEADMLERARQYGKAQAKITEAGAMLQTAKDVAVYQAANIVQLTPETNGEYNRNDFE